MSTGATVIVCTRNRPRDLERCLQSLLGEPDWLELIVVDQGRDEPAASVMSSVVGTARGAHYLRSRTVGLSAARNQGARAATGDLLLFTDDDCEIAKGWVSAWRRALESDPSVGVGFGLVEAPAFDPRQGHTPHFDPGPQEATWGLELFGHGASAVGMGANMALRREVWLSLGGFDESLGAGARFPAAEELDIAFRSLRAGRRLIHTRAAAVLHHGYRPRPDASRLVRGYAAGTAAMYMKHMRCGDWRAASLLAGDLRRQLLLVGRRSLTGRRPLGVNSVVSFVRGMAQSRSQAVDVRCRLFRQ